MWISGCLGHSARTKFSVSPCPAMKKEAAPCSDWPKWRTWRFAWFVWAPWPSAKLNVNPHALPPQLWLKVSSRLLARLGTCQTASLLNFSLGCSCSRHKVQGRWQVSRRSLSRNFPTARLSWCLDTADSLLVRAVFLLKYSADRKICAACCALPLAARRCLDREKCTVRKKEAHSYHKELHLNWLPSGWGMVSAWRHARRWWRPHSQ